MNLIRTTLALFLALATVLGLSACGREPVAEQEAAENSINLIPLHRYARQEVETGMLDLDSVRTSYYFLGGSWSAPYPEEAFEDTAILAVKRESRMRFAVLQPRDRWLVFNAAAQGRFGGPEAQTALVKVNNVEVGTISLQGEEITRQQIFIPADIQREGDNIVVLDFAAFDTEADYFESRNKRRRFPYRGLAGYFSGMRIVFGNEQGPDDGAYREYDDIFVAAAEDRMLRQRPQSRLSYAFDTGAGTTLTYAGTIEAPEGEAAALTLSIQKRTNENREWRDVWGATVDFAAGQTPEPFEGTLTVDETGHEAFEVRFVVNSSTSNSGASVVWKQLNMQLPEQHEETVVEERARVRINEEIKHVVIIACDAFRADLLKQIGGDDTYTPFISSLADESLVFSQAIAAAPYTVASVSSIFSSLIPDAHGVRRGRSNFPDHLDTMAKAFNRKDYYTMVLAGLPFIKRKFGITRAMEKEVYLRPEEDRELDINRMDLDLIRSSLTEAVNSDKPIFVYTHLLPPHWPYSPPPPFGDLENHDPKEEARKRTKLRRDLSNKRVDASSPAMIEHKEAYLRTMQYADYLVQEMVAHLKELGIYKNTLLIIGADHGEAFGEHNSLGHSSTVYDHMIHVPMVWHFPGIQARVVDQPVGNVDIFPTLAELLDMEVQNPYIHGRSLAPMVMGGSQPPADYYYSRAVDYTNGLKIEGEEYVLIRTRFTLRGLKYKYIFNDWDEELYDLETDPEELNNLAGILPATTTALRQRGFALIKHAESIRKGVNETEIGEDEDELKDLGYLQ